MTNAKLRKMRRLLRALDEIRSKIRAAVRRQTPLRTYGQDTNAIYFMGKDGPWRLNANRPPEKMWSDLTNA